MSKTETVTPILDQYRETLIETRLKVLTNLEACIRSQELDSFEALNKLSAILLLPRPTALTYARSMGTPKLWERAQ